MEECPKLKSTVSSKENNPGGSSNADIDEDYSSHLFCQPHKVSFGSLQKLFTDQNPCCGHEIPVSIFKGLEELEIFEYKGDMSLFTSSIAQNFVILRILSIGKCDKMVHVFQDEEENTVSGGQKTVPFPNLQELELRDLRKLKRFCKWKCDIELPSLSQVIIVKCPMMTNFTLKQPLSAIAQLQILHIEECEMMEQVFLWNKEDNQRNIDTTLAFSKLTSLSLKSLPKLTSLCKGIESFEFPQLTQIQVKDCPLLMDNVFSMNLFLEPDKVKMEIWKNQPFRNAEYLSLEGNAYRNLDVQKVQNMRWLTFRECSRGTKLVNVTTMDTLFPQLEVLRLLKLPELEEIWEIDGHIKSNSFKNLKELRLEFLPALKHLWQSNSSSSQMNIVSIFSKLSSLYIYGCHQLYSLFSLPVMETDSCLLQLEELVIKSCDRMEHLFFWNEGENKSNIHIPKLKVLILDSLPKLTCFCRGIENFEFPSLDQKRISRCPLLGNFVSTDNHHDDYIDLFCKLDDKDQEKMELKLQGNITLGRNKIQECVEYMSFEGDGSTSSDFGVGESMRCLTFIKSMGTKLMNMTTIATLFPLIKVLSLRECSMGTELMNMTTIATPFPCLEVLCLVNITELEEIWDIDGPKNINELRLKSVPALKHLWRSSSSPSQMNAISIFSNLSSIYIHGCHELCNLFSLLVTDMGSCVLQLENLVIESCKMMEQVFLWNEEESQRSIVFPKLKVLKLDSLPKLMSFCQGTKSFKFPLLVEMRISRCPQQNLFSTDDSPIDHDHDSTHLFCKADKIRTSPSQMNVDVSIFNKLSCIYIYGCHKLCNLFPLSMMGTGSCPLPLERLEIENCEMMEQVFLWKEKNIHVEKFPTLKFLSLSFLPKLRNICKGIERIQCPLLDKMKIINCPQLESLVYWDKKFTFIFNSSRSAQLQRGKGANTAWQPQEKQQQQQEVEEEQRPTHRRSKTM